MKISELKAGTGSVNIDAKVSNIEDTREINKYGRTLRVANATIEDASGSISLVLWNDAIDQAKSWNTIKI